MNSAFFVFNLVAGNARSKRKREARRFIQTKLDDAEEAVWLIIGQELTAFRRLVLCQIQRMPSEQLSAKAS